MISYNLSRRNFIWSLGAATGLATWLDRAIAQEEGKLDPRRFVVFQRPVGTIPENFWPGGNSNNLADGELSRILAPFEAFKSNMSLFRGLGLPHGGSAGGGHERGTLLCVTGRKSPQLYPGNGGDDPVATGPSVDQLLLAGSAVLRDVPVQSLQVSCDQRADTPGEVSPRHLSYSGPRAPMTPYYQARQTYERVFGTLSGVDGEELSRARLAKKSVLDFALKDLARMRTLAPSTQREKLDAYEDAVRELENELAVDPSDPVFCGVPMVPENIEVSQRTNPYESDNTSPERDDDKHRRIGEQHLAVIRAAFRCDLTRTVTFQWSPGTNHVSFADMWPPDPSIFKVHHTTSHKSLDQNITEFLTRIEVWYAQRAAAFLTSLMETTDITGKPIFDSTVMAYITEVSLGFNHSWDNMPWVLFGGKDTGFQGGQYWRHSGGRPSSATSNNQRSTNDLWMACGKPFGFDNFVLGDDNTMHSSAIEGVFV